MGKELSKESVLLELVLKKITFPLFKGTWEEVVGHEEQGKTQRRADTKWMNSVMKHFKGIDTDEVVRTFEAWMKKEAQLRTLDTALFNISNVMVKDFLTNPSHEIGLGDFNNPLLSGSEGGGRRSRRRTIKQGSKRRRRKTKRRRTKRRRTKQR